MSRTLEINILPPKGWTILDVVEEDVFVALNDSGKAAILALVGERVIKLSQESSYERTIGVAEMLKDLSATYRSDQSFLAQFA